MITHVVSPHLDDAVLSLGGIIREALVVTVFAGVPPEWSWPAPFDSASGFTSSDAAVRERRREDIHALAVLDCACKHLRFLDSQYGIGQPVDDIAREITYFARHFPGGEIAMPLGLAHPDHRLVAAICRQVAREVGRPVVVYADLPSAVLYPGHVDGALRGWERAGFTLTPIEWTSDLELKREAVDRYGSQRRFPELAHENLTEERGWIAQPHHD